jgi:hypothetical protein
MKILKTILKIFLVLSAMLLIAALILPKKYSVSVSTTIHKPKQVVMDYMRILKNQENYSVWVMEDSNLVPVITGVDGQVGAKQSWNSTNKSVGEGDQTITNITDNRIDVDLKFVRPMKGEAKASNIFESIDSNSTKVIAEFYGENPFPMNLLSFIGKKYISEAEVQNLANVKKNLEQ